MGKSGWSYFSLLILCFLMGGPLAKGQFSVMPGDANRNGRVDHFDVLHVGYAFGSIGPSRLYGNGAPIIQSIPQLWPTYFPDGVNYAYADCDGNGIIHWQDFLNIFQNYHVEQDSVTAINFPNPLVGLDPQLAFAQSSITVFPGDFLEIPILLEYPQGQETDFQGIAFSMEYNPEHFDGVVINYQNGFAFNNQQFFYFQNTPSPNSGILETALTRFGQNPYTGAGVIGNAAIIIEDDLIGLLITPQDSIETTIRIKDALFKDGDFFSVPVFTDSIRLVVRHPDAVSGTQNFANNQELRLYPNPGSGKFYVQTPNSVNMLSVWDSSGRQVFLKSETDGNFHALDLSYLPDGMYTIIANSHSGNIQKRFLIVH